MMHTLVPIVAAALVVTYWVVCRRRSLVYRERAAELLEAFFEKKGVEESEKDAAHFFYKFAQWWFFMPLMTIAAFPILFMRMFSGRGEMASSKDRHEITDQIMKMYLFRNPITGTICLMVFCFVALVAMLMGLLANRMRAFTFPSPSSVYMTTAKACHHPRRHAH